MEEEDYELLEDDEPLEDDVEIESDEVVEETPEYPEEDIMIGKPKFSTAYDLAYFLKCPRCSAVFSNKLTFCPECGFVIPNEVRREVKIRKGVKTDHRFMRYLTKKHF